MNDRLKGVEPSIKQRQPPKPQLASSTHQFSPSSVINRFVTLRVLASSDASLSSPPTIRPTFDVLPNQAQPSSSTRKQYSGPGKSASVSEFSTSISIPVLKKQECLDFDIYRKRKYKQQTTEMIEKIGVDHCSTRSPKPTARLYDPLPQLDLSDSHRYIATNRVLQNTNIIRALNDHKRCNVELIERDIEYLRVLLPESTDDRSITRVEADVILDEGNGVVLYPLREIGQSTLHDPDAGLNELLLVLGRIGPRYKVIWLILEEYSWGKSQSTFRDRSFASKAVLKRNRNSKPKDSTGASDALDIDSGIPKASEPNKYNGQPLQLDPYAGPAIFQLKKLIGWALITHDQQSWWARRSLPYTVSQDEHLVGFTGISNQQFETRILFASDESSTAWTIRMVGNEIANSIQNQARLGVRREEDGWQDREEWVWREWLNERDSTHERFLESFQIFNLFSVQLILSSCSLKDFMVMSHRERLNAVGKFIDHNILIAFDKLVTTPLN